jgi:hypothetical protein
MHNASNTAFGKVGGFFAFCAKKVTAFPNPGDLICYTWLN